MKPSVLLKTTFLLALAATLSAGCKRTKPGAGAEFDGEQINPGDELSWSGDMPLSGGSFQDPSLYEPVATPAGVYPVYFRYNESAIPAGELSKVDAVAALLLQSPQLLQQQKRKQLLQKRQQKHQQMKERFLTSTAGTKSSRVVSSATIPDTKK